MNTIKDRTEAAVNAEIERLEAMNASLLAITMQVTDWKAEALQRRTEAAVNAEIERLEAMNASLLASTMQVTDWKAEALQRRTEAAVNAEIERLEAMNASLLAVLTEVDECAEYWSKYDVPLGLHGRIKDALREGQEGIRREILR